MMTATTYIIIVSALIWIVWDIILYIRRYDDPKVSTISMMLTRFSWYSPALPFIMGFLMGHWFWPA